MSDLITVALITAVPSTIAAITGVLNAVSTRATRREMAVVSVQTNHLATLAAAKSSEAGIAQGQYDEAVRQQVIAARLATETAATAAERSREYEKLVDERSKTQESAEEFWKPENGDPVDVRVVTDDDEPLPVKVVERNEGDDA